MNKKEIGELTSGLAEIRKDLDRLQALAVDFSTPREFGSDNPLAVALGSRVRVFATWIDKDEEGIFGNQAIVTRVPDPEGFVYPIEVEFTGGSLMGKRFRVWPQQCQIVKEPHG